MIGVAIVFGLLAVFVAQSWLKSQAEARLRSLEANKKPLLTQTIVVASRPLRFGNELVPQALREIAWPRESLPAGAFAKIDELMSAGRRVVLTAIEPNEPVLAAKITGPGQRATLSSMVAQDMKAVTIRVNDVDGVGGFVLPGDHVDVSMTRQDKETAWSQVLMQDVKVLAVDQLADERVDKPSIAKAVTLEVDVAGAQKLSLASQIGTLSLILRKAGETTSSRTARITLKDLMSDFIPEKTQSKTATVTVMRASAKTEYSVVKESDPKLAAVGTAAGDGK
jgi:pilus assembly protein CpaB